MSNKKESSLEWLEKNIMIHKIWVVDHWEYHFSERSLEWMLSQAKAMHKEEIEKSWWDGHDNGNSENKIYPSENCNNYYNETFGGDNE